MGGFDEDFVGRGGEDFEFMIKLALYKNVIKPTKDLMINKFYKAPLLSEGFRKYLTFNGLPYFFEKKLLFIFIMEEIGCVDILDSMIKTQIFYKKKLNLLLT